MMCLAAMTASAQTARQSSDSLYIQKSYSQEQMLMPVNPTYLKNVSEAANWGRNWFIEAKGGASAFLGTPIGCGDVFDRVTPLLQIGVGKWFTPAIGGRIGFQGLSFKNAEFHTMKYQFVHADFLCNITSGIRQNESGIPLWDVIPFVGVGMIHNSDWINNCTCQGGSSGSHPFAFTYGVEARYRISDRVHLVGEVSGMLTARNFDGIGTSTKFGDNMISVSAGLSFTIGKTGWKRVVNATPYIEQNLALQDYIAYMRDRNAHLEKRLAGNDDGKTVYPKNSYSGLNSLRARLSMNGDSLSSSDRLKVSIGVPVYFFFKLNSDKLVDKSQLVNLDDIAKMAKQENLKIKISGAADSATGTQSGNQDLGKRRAKFIAKALIKRGVDKSQIKAYNLGGIDKYAANEANRFTTVVLLK
jgi:outer membrane protein OmpA-like peptidoglycan-associated protein